MALIGSTIIFRVLRTMIQPNRRTSTTIAMKYCRQNVESLRSSPLRVMSDRTNPIVSPASFFIGTPAVQIHPYFSILLMSYSIPSPFQLRNLFISRGSISSQYPGRATSSSDGSAI